VTGNIIFLPLVALATYASFIRDTPSELNSTEVSYA